MPVWVVLTYGDDGPTLAFGVYTKEDAAKTTADRINRSTWYGREARVMPTNLHDNPIPEEWVHDNPAHYWAE